MIGVVVPVHNEEACLEGCLMALSAAALHPDLDSEPVLVVVVLDGCDDDSHAIAQRHATTPLICLSISARNVGMARHAGAEYLLARDARWLAFTDADSRVAPDWLCEVVSPSTARLDRERKMPHYACHGVAVVWLVDPLARTLEVHRLEGGAYVRVAAHGDEDVIRAEPFAAVELALARLWTV